MNTLSETTMDEMEQMRQHNDQRYEELRSQMGECLMCLREVKQALEQLRAQPQMAHPSPSERMSSQQQHQLPPPSPPSPQQPPSVTYPIPQFTSHQSHTSSNPMPPQQSSPTPSPQQQQPRQQHLCPEEFLRQYLEMLTATQQPPPLKQERSPLPQRKSECSYDVDQVRRLNSSDGTHLPLMLTTLVPLTACISGVGKRS